MTPPLQQQQSSWSSDSDFITPSNITNDTDVSFSDTALTSSNTIQFRVVDTAGNTGAVAEQDVTIDTTAPTTTITINSISDDSGSSDSDFITSDDDGLTINATLSQTLGAGETLEYSNDDGSTWSAVSSGDITNDTDVSFADTALTSSNTIQFRVVDTAGNTGAVAEQDVTIDTTAPTTTITINSISDDSGSSD